jgi:hypothetical protein
MTDAPDELRETWESRDGKVVAAGDTVMINEWLASKLEKVRADNWRILYRHRESGEFWELTYPHGELHGGGPRLLRRVTWYVVELRLSASTAQAPVESWSLCATTLEEAKSSAISILEGRRSRIGANGLRLKKRDGEFIWEYP